MTVTSNSAVFPETHSNAICPNSLRAAWGPSPELSPLLPSVSEEAGESFILWRGGEGVRVPGGRQVAVNQQTAVDHPLLHLTLD